MTLIHFEHPYMTPSNCPRHPLYSEPCPLCSLEDEKKRNNELEIEFNVEETFETQDVYVRDDERDGTGETS